MLYKYLFKTCHLLHLTVLLLCVSPVCIEKLSGIGSLEGLVSEGPNKEMGGSSLVGDLEERLSFLRLQLHKE